MSEERELLKRIKILLECSYYYDNGLLATKAPKIISEIENLLSQESDNKRVWYQKGYEQAKQDFEKKITNGIRVYAYLDCGRYEAMDLVIERGLKHNATLILDDNFEEMK